MTFVDRQRELAALEGFWASPGAECIPVVGRRRVGKTFLLEHFACDKRVLYFRCQLKPTAEQLADLGVALAELSSDPLALAQPPSQWPGVFALIERLAGEERLLLVLDELPYWVARDESLPSLLQNWWDRRGRTLNLMLVLCGSAVQMMENLLSGEAPLAGCITGRLALRPLDFRAAASLLGYADPLAALTAYGILGGVPLYLGFFDPQRSLAENISRAIASPTARLYVEPQTVFAAHHKSFAAAQALDTLRAIAQGKHRWSEIAEGIGVQPPALTRIMEPLLGDLALVERVLPVTETRQCKTYHTQYRLTDNFFRFWFTFIEPNQGEIEFGGGERVVATIMERLPDYMGPAFEAMGRDWLRLATAAGAIHVRVVKVGNWWNPNHELDVVGLDERGRVVVTGEAKWHNRPFGWDDLERYLAHVAALGDRVHPELLHILLSKSGFSPRVVEWATGNRVRLLTPADMLAPFTPASSAMNG